MKRFLLLILLLSVAASAPAQEAVRIMLDQDGTMVDPNHRFPVDIGSLTAAIASVSVTLAGVLDTRAELATDSIGLISALEAVGAAVASVTAELAAPLQVESTISTDSIGLISAVGNVAAAVASVVAEIDASFATGTCEILSTGLIATDIPATTNRVWVFIHNIGTETVWVKEFSAEASPSFPLGGSPLLQYDSILFRFPASVPIGYVSSSPGTIKVTQGVK